MHARARVPGVMLFALLISACVTDAQFLAQNTSAATQTTESRAKFELDCPQVQTTSLSQKVVQSIQQGYGWRGGGMHAGPWTEYTIGVRGCGRQAVYMALCRDPANCNAFAQGAEVQPVLPATSQ
ncbi:hypothetical protein [Methylotetracoccus oryzae]|uniref:hypothetical protein n=1 Tax=Methylotetracoccus oryzae TaxID=1919059 RepID=UPI0013A5ABDC|nr:hypothetical protein [Methylotetracoccus oryzae]